MRHLGKNGNKRLEESATTKKCGADSQLMLAIQCKDGTQKLACPFDDDAFCTKPNESWAETRCNKHGGYDHVLPYYTGCYPKSTTFWEDHYAPDTVIGEDVCDADIPVPALNLANLDFEDSDLGTSEWEHAVIPIEDLVS